jgi:hypothetical protein
MAKRHQSPIRGIRSFKTNLRETAASLDVLDVKLPGAAPFVFKGAGFDFASFSFIPHPPAPFNPPYCRSTLNFLHSL